MAAAALNRDKQGQPTSELQWIFAGALALHQFTMKHDMLSKSQKAAVRKVLRTELAAVSWHILG